MNDVELKIKEILTVLPQIQSKEGFIALSHLLVTLLLYRPTTVKEDRTILDRIIELAGKFK